MAAYSRMAQSGEKPSNKPMRATCNSSGKPLRLVNCRAKSFLPCHNAPSRFRPFFVSYRSSRPVLRCSWHRWEFDMETGRALTPTKQRLKIDNVAASEGEDESRWSLRKTNITV
jgi:hypothetical protein